MTEPIAGLEQGIEILDPFLKQHDFRFHGFEDIKGSGRHFTLAKFKNERKEFILGYHFSVGQIVYQFDKLSVGHDFYLDKLGFGDKRKFVDIQTEDKLLPFQHILSDFDYLVEDFFRGECQRLKEYSRLQDNIIKEYDQKAREGYNRQFDELRIEQARAEFKNKNFKKSIELYMSIDFKSLMNDLDGKIIEFCKKHF
ncbi:MAG TPA: hypothetical protein VIL99_14350 [Ignavibacteria bacterium]